MVDFSSAVTEDGGTLLELLKQYLGIDPSDTTDDAALTRAVNLSGYLTESYLDRVVLKRPVEEYFAHHFGTVVLHHPQVDPSVPVVVSLNGADQTGYSIWLSRGKLGNLSNTGYPQDVPMDWRTFAQVVVTYTAGYDPIPSDIAQAITYTAADLFGSEGTGSTPGGASGDIKSMSIVDVGSMSFDVGSSGSSGGGVFSSSSPIPDTAVQMLTRYRRMSA